MAAKDRSRSISAWARPAVLDLGPRIGNNTVSHTPTKKGPGNAKGRERAGKEAEVSKGKNN